MKFRDSKKLRVEAQQCLAEDMNLRLDRAARKLGALSHGHQAALDREKQERACRIGEIWHAHVSRLYPSKRACVAYGHGGQKDRSWPYKGTMRSYPAIWHNAGAEWAGRGRLRLEDSQGRLVVVLRLPAGADGNGATHGDLFTTPVPGSHGLVRVRHDIHGLKTGVAVRVGDTWEHASTVEEANAEVAHKRAIAELAERTEKLTAREARRHRLLGRISEKIIVSRDHARATGACAAGVAAWCARFGFADAAPARAVFRAALASGERRAQAAVLLAVRHALSAP